jgi:hypothetical protein
MHVILKNQVTKETEGIICIERESGTAVILEGDIERLDDMVKIALAMKVPGVQLVVPEAAVEQLESLGWKRAVGQVVLTKGV